MPNLQHADCNVHNMQIQSSDIFGADMNHRQIIDLWPSVKVLAEDLGEKQSAVNGWYYRESIPSDRWVKLVSAAQERDIPLTYKMLAEAIAA